MLLYVFGSSYSSWFILPFGASMVRSMVLAIWLSSMVGGCAPAREYPGEQSDSKEVVLADGLRYIELGPGSGIEATRGMVVSVHYTGYLMDGKKFHSSRDSNIPLTFILGEGQVISGWDEGLLSMTVHQKRKLIIPPHLGYGDKGVPGLIPPGSELVFDVELVEARDPGQ